MRIAVVGAGPAGLYFSYLMKRDDPAHQVHVFEQNRRDATFGFGVVFSDRALEFLRDADVDTYRYLMPHMQSWPDLKIVHKGRQVPIDGNGFAAIGRLQLLSLLCARAAAAGVEVAFERTIRSVENLADADLIVGADGVNSTMRRRHAAAFGATEGRLGNRFIWYGTSKRFDCLTLTFREYRHGVLCAHHYRYAPAMSTFIVECDAATWERAGFAEMGEDAARAHCEAVFAPDLEGHPLVSNASVWRTFPAIRNQRWQDRNMVLVGDALRTVHFSIGSGTRLAMEDAIALAAALKRHPGELAAAFADYRETRRPAVETLVAAAESSARWYQRMGEMMSLDPYDFAYDYMTRTGRVSERRLRRIAPNFMARFRVRKSSR